MLVAPSGRKEPQPVEQSPFDESFVASACYQVTPGRERTADRQRLGRVPESQVWRPPPAPAGSSDSYRNMMARRLWSGLALLACLLAVGVTLLPAGATRVTARTDVPPVPADAAAAPLGKPPPPPAGGGGFAFLHTRLGSDQPVACDPCRPVHWVMRPGGAPDLGQKLLEESFAKLSAATGLTFVYDGSTSERPGETRELVQVDRYGDRWAPVLVAWSNAQESPALAGEVSGFAGPAVEEDGGPHLVSGVVVLDAPQLTDARGGANGFAASTILHEIGHVVGLAHVGDPGQLMYESARAQTTYAAGDLRGLAALGRGPCSTRPLP